MMIDIEKKNTGMKLDYYLLQQAKEEYVMIHGHFSSHPELLRDFTTRCVYDNLMAVKTPEDLEQWLNSIAKTELSLDNAPAMSNGVSWDNLLGRYEHLVRFLSTEKRAMLAEDMVAIRTGGYEKYFNKDAMTLLSDASKEMCKDFNSVVILSDQLDNHVAVEADADYLFEKFGWQTATVEVGDERMSIMPLCDDIIQADGMPPSHSRPSTLSARACRRTTSCSPL